MRGLGYMLYWLNQIVVLVQHKPSSSPTSHSVQVELTDACPTFVCRRVHCDRKFYELRGELTKQEKLNSSRKPETDHH